MKSGGLESINHAVTGKGEKLFFKRVNWDLNYTERILLVISVVVIYIQYQTINSYSSQRNPWKTIKFEESTWKKMDNISQPQGSCNLPNLLPFHPAVLSYLNDTLEMPNCQKKHQLLFTLDYNANLVALKDLKKVGYQDCSYCRLLRQSGNDSDVKISNECRKITQSSTKIRTDWEYIAVKCKNIKSKQNRLIDIFAAVRLKPAVKARIKNQKRKLKSSKDDPELNIIVLGIDSVSQMSFLRSMNKTSVYLKTLNAIGMKGYAKHGENTFENIVSVLTGKSVKELRSSCWKKVTDQFDKCPFIWRLFSQKGYITSYLEDDPQLAAFNNVRNGFKTPPVDYYLRPANLGLFKHLGHTRIGSPTVCLGPRLSFDISLDYLKRVVHTVGKDRKYFVFSWTDSLTHDVLTSSSLVDGKIFEAVTWLNEGGYLNDTVFVLMSDHGLRHGAFSNSYQGSIEIRMPMLYFVFPGWFQKKYQRGIRNLKKNSHKLSTHFDLHETLLDILYIGNVTDKSIEARSDMLETKASAGVTPRGISLFLPVPDSRTCQNAGIGEDNCLCTEMREHGLEEDETLSAAEALVDSINFRLSKYPKCSQLRLLKIYAAATPDIGYINNIRITMSTTPGEATFQGTALRSRKSEAGKRAWKLSGVISRTNIYRSQSHCVHEQFVKPYCYCKSAVHNII